MTDRLCKLYVAGRLIRLGSYGDPVAVPLGVWTEVLSWSGGHTGYTHQWHRPDSQDYAGILMASVETKAQRIEANALGWRTYRIIGETERPGKGEITCLAAKERKMRTTCAECLLCDGAARTGNRPDITIRLHGSPSVIHTGPASTRGPQSNPETRREGERLPMATPTEQTLRPDQKRPDPGKRPP
jgi:hypothetical protein